MAERVCAGCGEVLAEGRSVCPACGRLNGAPAPDVAVPTPPSAYAPPPPSAAYAPPAAPAPPTAWTPQPYGVPSAFGARPPMAPLPKASRSGPIIGALVAVLVLVLGIGGVVVAVRHQRDQDRADEVRDRKEEADRDREAADESATSPQADVPASQDDTRPVEDGRTLVDAGGGLTWTMRGDPKASPTSGSNAQGVQMDATMWMGELDGGVEGDLAVVLDLDGLTYSEDLGLQGILERSGGTAIGKPTSITMGGRSGRTIAARIESDGSQGIARYAVAQFDDRVLVVGSFAEGIDTELGKKEFAALVASVRYE